MNKTHLHNILSQYIDQYDMLYDPDGHDEGYKWDAVSCFQENWNIESNDFASMFKKATEKTSNLINNGQVQPVNGIYILASKFNEADFVRNCFKELLKDDNGDIDLRQQRVLDFIEKINSRIEYHIKGSWKYQQNLSAVIFYLNMWRPSENYIYKYSVATEWANCIEYGEDFGSGMTFSLKKYYNMCDELLYELERNSTIMALYNKQITKFNKFNDKGHILVYDLIYCAKTYNLYKNVPSFQKITTKQRLKLAENTQKKEDLLERYAEISTELESITKRIILPDISGEPVTHKLWGKGKVFSCKNNIIKIEFDKEKKNLIYPDCINTFIFLENQTHIDFFNSLSENLREKHNLENELNYITKELDNITR